MSELVFIYFCEIMITASALTGIILILIASWHDLHTIAEKKILAILTQRMSRSRQPSIAVLIHTHNNQQTLLACLESIRHSDYDNYHAVIVDNASTDQTSRLLTTYKRTHPGVPLTIYKRRKETDRLSALRAGYKKIHPTDLILLHDADSTISAMTMKQCAARFVANEHATSIHLRQIVAFEYSVMSLIAAFLSLSRNMVAKAWPRFNGTIIDGPQETIIMRADHFLRQHYSIRRTTSYAQSITYRPLSSTVKAITSHQRPLPTLAVILASTIVIVMVTYFLTTAAVLRSSSLLAISWLMVDIWLMVTIWSDEVTDRRTKIALSLAVPFMYFVFYVYLSLQTIVRIVTIVRFIPTPHPALHSLRQAIQVELYSTRY